MNDLYNSLIENAPAIGTIFEVGEEPKEENFYLVKDEILEIVRSQGIDTKENLYLWVPNNIKVEGKELLVFTKEEKDNLLEGREIIEELYKMGDEKNENFNDKLIFVSKVLPNNFINCISRN